MLPHVIYALILRCRRQAASKDAMTGKVTAPRDGSSFEARFASTSG